MSVRDPVYVTPDQNREHLKKFGGYNDFPPGWKEITEDEFWHKFMLYSWDREEYRQMMDRENLKSGVVDARLFFYNDGSGIACTREAKNASITRPRFYRFALCEHDYETVRRGRCYSEHRCRKCGHRRTLDSSD